MYLVKQFDLYIHSKLGLSKLNNLLLMNLYFSNYKKQIHT